jgi:hypothetical protein
MRRAVMGSGVLLLCLLGLAARGWPDGPKPFGFEVGKTTYQQALDILKARNWKYQEYDKKSFNLIDVDSPSRGKHSFLLVVPKDTKGIAGVRLFFDKQSDLDAVILILEPALFDGVMDELDHKYTPVKRNLAGENFTDDYTFVLWEKDDVYIELQKLSAHHVRLIYVQKVLYENYKDFLFKTYEPFRKRQLKPDWMKEL